jgi:hypothetical protein
MIQNAKIVGDCILPSVYMDEPNQRGHIDHAFRSHTASEILRNPRRWALGYQSPESKIKEWGCGWDCVLFVPNQMPLRYAVVPEDAPKKPSKAQLNAKKPSPETVAAIAWWKDFIENNPGEIIDAELREEWHAATRRLREDKLIADLLDSSQRQVMVTAHWCDKATGLTVPLKALIDLVPHVDHPVFGSSLWDGKTTSNASPRSFKQDAQRYGYHIQAAFYLDLWNAASGHGRSDFGHIIQENYAPYEFRSPPPLLSQRFINLGRLMYQRALGIYCQALKTGVWPGYDKVSKDWPITDCDDWMLQVDEVFDAWEDAAEEAFGPLDEEAPKDEVTP